MSTKKQLNTKLLATKIVLGVVAALGLGLGVHAFTSQSTSPPNTVIEHADTVTVNQPAPAEQAQPEATLGAVSTRPSAYEEQNTDGVYHLVQTNTSGSSTIFAFTDPFLQTTTTAGDIVVTASGDLVNGLGQTGATSTVELGRIYVTTAATTTYSVMCATAATPYATSSLSQSLIETGTSVSSTPVIESGFYNPANSGVGAAVSAPWYANSSTTLPRVMLTPATPYLICKVNAAASSAFVGNSNFAAKMLIRVSRLRF